MKTLNDVREFLSEIPAIDWGGCGISALAMIRWMKKNMCVDDIFIIFTHYDYSYYESNRDYFEKKNDKISAPSHVILFHNGVYFDCDTYYEQDELRRVLQTDNENVLLEAINNINSWNGMFDREYVWEIEKRLKINLSDVVIC